MGNETEMKKKPSWNSKRIWLLLIVGTHILLFQNCSKISFQSQDTESAFKSRNGDVYGGKPQGTFYRFSPDWACEGKPASVSSVEVNDAKVTLVENLSLQCGKRTPDVDADLIDLSIFQQEIIGYKEGIFEGLTIKPESIPANLVEVWCRTKSEDQEVETITRYDRNANLAVSRIYYSQNGISKQINDFTVSRVASQSTVIVKDPAGSFDLTVHRDQPSPQPGQFKADLTLIIDGKSLSIDTSCRLGGSVDPKVWPARQIVDLNSTNFLFSTDLKSMAWSSNSISNARIYTAKVDGSQLRPVSPPNLTISKSQSVWFAPDSKSVLYAGDVNTPTVVELFKVNLDGSQALQINDPLTAHFQNVETDIKFNADSSRVFYKDGSQLTSAIDELWLRSNSLSGGPPQVLFPPPSAALIQAPPGNCSRKPVSRKFDYSPKYDLVALLGGGDFCEDLYFVNADGTNLKKVTPILPSADWRFDWGSAITSPPGSDFAVTLARNSGVQQQFYAVAFNGSNSFPVTEPFSSPAEISLASGNILTISFQQSKSLLVNLATRKNWQIPLLSSPFLSQDHARLFGISPEGIALSISTVDGHSENICAGTNRKVIFLNAFDKESLLVGFYDSQAQVQIELWEPAGACTNLTSLPIKNLKDVSLIKIAPDQKRLLMRVGFPNEDRKSLYYVPLNRQSPLLVNMPILNDGKVLEAQFSEDSRSIIYYGSQLGPSEFHVFLWQVPEDLKNGK